MKERPILFTGPMVRAILDRTKTQTRRVVRPQPVGIEEPEEGFMYCGDDGIVSGRQRYQTDADGGFYVDWVEFPTRCPYGIPGDRLWVRETWAQHPMDEQDPPEHIIMREDGSNWWCHDPIKRGDKNSDCPPWNVSRWRPSIYMPRWASRITLEITDIRVERVQEISEEDAKAEGVRLNVDQDGKPLLKLTGARPIREWTFKEHFADLWDSINGKKPGRSWDDNPWVWVIHFRREVMKTFTCGDCPWVDGCEDYFGDRGSECRKRKAFRVVRDVFRWAWQSLKACEQWNEGLQATAELQRGFMLAHYRPHYWRSRACLEVDTQYLCDGCHEKHHKRIDDLKSELARVKGEVLRISQIYNAWANGDEPEGAPSKSRALSAIGEILGKPF